MYGWLARAWSGGGTPASRLSDWLDPAGTQASAIDGMEAEGPSVTVAAAVEGLAVRWAAVSDADGYRVQWKAGTQAYASSREAAVASTSHTISGLTAGTEYTVRVRATRVDAADGLWSAAQTGTPAAAAADQLRGFTVTAAVESLALSWSAVADAAGYEVQWKAGAQDYGSSRQGTVSDGSTTTHAISGLAAGTQVTVRARATRTGADAGAWSAEGTGTPKAASPAEVTGVDVTPKLRSLSVSWDAVADAAGYRVQWKAGAQTYDVSRQATVAGTSHTIEGLGGGTRYTLRVRATRIHADDGAWSAEAAGTAQAPPPAQVQGLRAVGLVEGLGLIWESVAAADDYTVQWKAGDEAYASSRQATVSAWPTALRLYQIRNLRAGTEYTGRVRATRDHADAGAWSAEATARARAATPAQVSGVTVAPGAEQVVVRWAAVSGATGYTVQWKAGGQAYTSARQAPIADGTTTTYTITGLVAGAEYTVRVRATRDHAADGAWSAEATGTPLAAAAGQVSQLTVTAGVEQVVVRWAAVSGATGYTVQWKSGRETYDASARQAVVRSGTTTSYTLTGLAAGTPVTVRVRATRTGAAPGAWAAEATGTPQAPPPPPPPSGGGSGSSGGGSGSGGGGGSGSGGGGGSGSGGGGGSGTGGGGGSGEDPEDTEVQGYLENPGAASFQSGIGVISGWVCEADEVVIEMETEGGAISRYVAAYGTERLDTRAVCGDVDNGFGLLVNWNRLGDGEHAVVAWVDGVELDHAPVTVTTLGEEFLRDGAGACVVADFPAPGATETLVWQEAQQNFVIAAGPPPRGMNHAGTPGVGYLENPSPHSFQSGIGVISGWVCEAATVELAIGSLGRQRAAYGTERLDTRAVCGDVDNGFGLLVNWNRLGTGEHAVIASVDGVELGRATVRVTTVGVGAEAEFLRAAAGECRVTDFPMRGETVTLGWQQNQQNFVITGVE